MPYKDQIDRRATIHFGMGLFATLALHGRAYGYLPEQSNALWRKEPNKPVLGGALGTCFDVCLIREDGLYKMWFSWRPRKSIALVTSSDGIKWSDPVLCLSGLPGSAWEEDVNRPIVVKKGGLYHLWYTGQARGRSAIGYARSEDGVSWKRVQEAPVMLPTSAWEGVAVMVPHVLWEPQIGGWRMWYSAGEQYEPNAIGIATSFDGVNWIKHPANPVLQPDKSIRWERERVTGAQIVHHNGYYYAFYIGFEDVDHARIGIARSVDGIQGWVRHAGNPIISPTPGGWDADACYKPFALQTDHEWVLWYNGRTATIEQIGRAVQRGSTLYFVERPA